MRGFRTSRILITHIYYSQFIAPLVHCNEAPVSSTPPTSSLKVKPLNLLILIMNKKQAALEVIEKSISMPFLSFRLCKQQVSLMKGAKMSEFYRILNKFVAWVNIFIMKWWWVLNSFSSALETSAIQILARSCKCFILIELFSGYGLYQGTNSYMFVPINFYCLNISILSLMREVEWSIQHVLR